MIGAVTHARFGSLVARHPSRCGTTCPASSRASGPWSPSSRATSPRSASPRSPDLTARPHRDPTRALGAAGGRVEHAAWTTRHTSRGSRRCAAGSRRAPSTRSTSAGCSSHELAEDADLDGLAPPARRGATPRRTPAASTCPAAGARRRVAPRPEAFLLRDGDRLESRPIKGTATSRDGHAAQGLRRERHDRRPGAQRPVATCAAPGTVEVDHLCALEEHPGLVHLVSTVSGQLRPGVGWAEIFERRRSRLVRVSGAPKSSALQAIARPRAGAARAVLRRRRLGRRRPRHGGARRRHPHVLGGARRRRAAGAAVRHRRRHHLGVGPRAGVGGDTRSRRRGSSGWRLGGLEA